PPARNNASALPFHVCSLAAQEQAVRPVMALAPVEKLSIARPAIQLPGLPPSQEDAVLVTICHIAVFPYQVEPRGIRNHRHASFRVRGTRYGNQQSCKLRRQ